MIRSFNPIRSATLAAALLAALLAAGGAWAAGTGMNHAEYAAQKDRIEADYKAGKASCDKLGGNAKDICVEQAKGKEKVALAELEANYSGTANDRNKVPVAKADAAYDIAKEKCDDQGGSAKDVCVQEAKADHARAIADAKSAQN